MKRRKNTNKTCRRLVRVIGLVIGLAIYGFGSVLAQPDGRESSVPANAGQSDTREGPAGDSEVIPARSPQQDQLDTWAATLDEIKESLAGDLPTPAELNVLRDRIDVISAGSDALITELRPQVQAVERRLVRLRPSDSSKPESAAVTAERERQERLLAVLAGVTKQAEVIQLRASDLVNFVIRLRQRQITTLIMTRSYSILDLNLWVELVEGLPQTFSALEFLVRSWINAMTSRLGPAAIVIVLVAFVLAYVVAYPVRRHLLDRAARDPTIIDPTPVQRSTAGLVVALLSTLVPAAMLVIVYLGLDFLDLTPDRIDSVLRTIFGGILFLAFAHGVSRAILAVNRSGWRLVQFSDESAEKYQRIVVALGVVFGVGWAVDGLAEILNAPLALLTASTGITAALTAILTIIGIRIVLRGQAEEIDPTLVTAARIAFRWYTLVAGFAAIVCLLALVIGYISLGWFIAKQLVWVLSILSILHLLLLFVDDLIMATFKQETRFGVMVRETTGVKDQRIVQTGVILSGSIRLILILVAALAILAPWGVQTSDFMGLARHILIGFTVGKFTFSPIDILIALLIFAVGLAVTRGLKRWLESRFLPQTDLDIGLQTSIHTSIGYLGIIIAVVIAFAFIGLDLQNIALVAGALSVGIGFGLQSIVNNFVSGLILLAERPIKVGDWIVVGAEQGYVKRINVRATEIETFDRAAVIVPNSDLISGVVKNWMHRGKTGRVRVPIGVSYDADPDQVRDILLGCARDNDMILRIPEPQVFFMEFGDSSLNFELRFFLREVDFSLAVSSAIRFDIIRRFREAGIEIPFPQRDINLRDIDRLETMAGSRGDSAESGKEAG